MEGLFSTILGIIIGAGGFFALIALIVFWAIKYAEKRRKFEHEERILAIEKGVEIPIAPPKEKNPYTLPFVLIGIGLAIVIGCVFIGHEDWIWGLVALFIGGGMLAARLLLKKQKEVKSDEDTLPEEKRTAGGNNYVA